MDGLLLAVLMAPGVMVVLLGLEQLEHRLLGSATTVTKISARS